MEINPGYIWAQYFEGRLALTRDYISICFFFFCEKHFLFFLENLVIKLWTKLTKLNLSFKLSNLNLNFALTQGYLNSPLNNPVQGLVSRKAR